MKIAYFDCFSGISGDMVLGAMIDAGLDFEQLKSELAKLPLSNYRIEVAKVEKRAIAATKVNVVAEEKGVVRTWPNVAGLLDASSLDEPIKAKARAVFLRLAQAESKIHRKALDQVHFHEIGAVDSIVDVVSAAAGLHLMGVHEVYSSALATGIGLIRTEHGPLPNPAPAVLEILEGAPIYSTGIPAELVTPTGAAIVRTVAREFGDMPPLKVERIGYGAGTADLDIPNVLRIVIGEAWPDRGKGDLELVLLAETNIDDVSPQVYSYLTEKLFAVGALDVWLTPIYMKKNRPGTSVSVLAPLDKEQAVLDALFEETATLGVRVLRQPRRVAEREVVEVETELGKAHVKLARLGERSVNIAPEYEDCARLARETDRPIREVMELVRAAARKQLGLD